MSSLFSIFLQVSKIPICFPSHSISIHFLIYTQYIKKIRIIHFQKTIFSHLYPMFHFTAPCFSHDVCNTTIYIRISCRFYSRHEVFKLSNSSDSLATGNFSSLLILYTKLTTECSLACLLQEINVRFFTSGKIKLISIK